MSHEGEIGGVDDRTLIVDMLRPFWKAMHQPHKAENPQPQPSHSAALKLDFDSTADDSKDLSNVKRRLSAEADVTPVKKAKQEASPTSVLSPWQVNRYKMEVLESRVQIDKLEKQVSHQHVIRKEMEELFENERQIFANERKSKDNALAEMENRLQKARSKETELREQISKYHKEFNEYKHSTDKEKQSYMKDIYDLKNEVATTKINCNESLSKLKNEMLELTQNLEICQNDLKEYKTAYEEAAGDAAKYIDMQDAFNRQTITLQQTEMRLREFENSKKDLEEVKILQKRLVNLPQLEREAARLREENTELRAAARQNLLLEEQVQFYKTRIDTLEPVYQNYCDLQKKYLDVEKTLDEWKRIGASYECAEPQLLMKQVEKLQNRELCLLSEKKDAESSLLTATAELMNVKHETKKSLTRLADVQTVQKNQESFIHRLQKKLLLVSRERDSYRSQLDSYEKELTMNIGGDSQPNANVVNSRVESLEKSLQGYKDLVAKLEEDMAAIRGNPAQQEQLTRLKEEILNLTRENEILRSRSDKFETQLEQSVMKSNENQPAIKILHMAVNPLSTAQDEAKKELERARAEIQHLKYRIKKMEARELEMSQKFSETINVKGPTEEEFNELKQQLESNNLKIQRMKEVYTSSSQEYKDVCYMLMGYKMDRTGVKNYRLSSMYADSPNQYLNFKLSGSDIEMMPSDYSSDISDMIDEHLRRHKSFPVFLSELTLDLFRRTTVISDSTMECTVQAEEGQ